MTFESAIRKFNYLASDPVLRRWLFGRLTGRWKGRPMVRETPPYLRHTELGRAAIPTFDVNSLPDLKPTSPINLSLAGKSLTLEPEDEESFVAREFADTESLLALHRFAWLENSDSIGIAPWVNVIFKAWVEKFDVNEAGWAWQPYTVAERLVNLINYSKKVGLPGEKEKSLAFLARHGPAIFDRLEYLGEKHVGNHLANNGRGLYLGGLELGIKNWANIGGQILIEEGSRIFSQRGILREGSSHYHLLVTQWYLECWLAALKHNRPELDALGDIAGRAVAILPIFDMPAGFPLIGDVSPDSSPDYLTGLFKRNHSGWMGSLTEADRNAWNALANENSEVSLIEDGWVRKDCGPWSTICYISPIGWSFLPGHGHQDFGGFELHYNDVALFCDLGRRSYGPSGAGDLSSEMHNTLLVDGVGSFPVNKPYYNDKFREQITGAKPSISCSIDKIVLKSDAYSRLKNVGAWEREWAFSDTRITLTDRIDGTGRHKIDRFLHSTLPFHGEENGFRIGSVKVFADGEIKHRPSKRWFSYGRSEPATSISITANVNLPWSSSITMETGAG